ncbi:MAG: PDZ domain-containing protein [Opitutaceae bacterium]|nr:PDZ domain-containing protein [Cytophagales bacterium]
MPIWLALTLAIGVFVGIYVGKKMGSADRFSKNNLVDEALQYIKNDYVDTVNIADLQQKGIEAMLEKLDAHSSYIPPKDLQVAKASLEADFEGIGIEFQIFSDTVNVITPISGGPSELVGLQSGDKIINVDNMPFAGTKITINDVFAKLRGEKGTKVKLTIKRKGIKNLMSFTIIRDKIPTYSVDAAFIYAPATGYIKLNRFGENTFTEFKNALVKLKDQGMKKLVLDLRDNPGGYLDHAANIADEFLSDDKLIVYTKGRKSQYCNTLKAEHEGVFEQGSLIVLVDEGSASASEIVSGALQDHDRALIVGRRTFGKGLVQMPISLSDGSELRLTISRYYTPSGRCIQKPYNGKEDYEKDYERRFKRGEMYSKDSIHFADTLKFKTEKGRTVYGGGGIMPDVFVPQDTTAFSSYLSQLLNKGVLRETAFELYETNKSRLTKMTLESFNESFVVSDNDLQRMVDKANVAGVKFNQKGFDRSKEYIRNYVKALIAKSVWKMDGFFYVFNQKDNVFIEAQKHWEEAANIIK